jgi:competence protein ComEC
MRKSFEFLAFAPLAPWHTPRLRRVMPQPFAALVLGLLALAGPAPFAELVPVAASTLAAALLVIALPRRLRLVAIVVVLVQVARVWVALTASDRAQLSLTSSFAERAPCTLEVLVTGAPSLRAEAVHFTAEVAQARCEGAHGEALVGRSIAVTADEASVHRGDRLAIEGGVTALRAIVAPWEPSPRFRAARGDALVSVRGESLELLSAGRGPLASIDSGRQRLRAFFVDRFVPPVAALLRALVLAEVDLEPAVARDFKRSGLSHVLAVSGMHLALVAGGALAIVTALVRRCPRIAARWPAQVVATVPAGLAAAAYAALTGFGGSSVRALGMLAAHAFFVLAGRRPSGASSLAASSLTVAALDPLALADLSTSLSLGATAALVLFGTRVSSCIPGPRVVAGAVGASLAATLGTAPILTAFALPVPLAGVVANLLAVPLGELVALPFALVGSMLVLVNAHGTAAVALAIAGAALTLVARVATFGASRPELVCALPVPSPATGGALLVFLVAAATLRAPVARRMALLAAITATALGEFVTRAAGGEPALRVTHLDVGQGDSTVVEFPEGPLWLVDGGGLIASPVDVGERTVVPALVNARRRPDVVVLTHPHPDHYGGLLAVLRDATPRELWDTGQGEHEGYAGAYAELLAQARALGVRVRRPHELCGVHHVGRARVEVMAPCPAASGDRGPNDNSFVLRVRFGDDAVLLTGDAERELEAELLRRFGTEGLRAGVLKVAHHGSRTSSTRAFLEAVAPSVAVISAGQRNRFGHPHPRTLETLRLGAAEIRRTDLLGTQREETTGRGWRWGTLAFSERLTRGAW